MDLQKARALFGDHHGAGIVVPRFYMNLRHRDRLFVDDEGDEVAADRVQEHTFKMARDLIAQARLETIRNWFDCSFEVMDEAGRVVLDFPFSETVPPVELP